jgi:hypothetical protein
MAALKARDATHSAVLELIRRVSGVVRWEVLKYGHRYPQWLLQLFDVGDPRLEIIALFFWDSQLTEDDFDDVKKLKELRTLVFHRSPISDELVAHIQMALPRCKIVRELPS